MQFTETVRFLKNEYIIKCYSLNTLINGLFQYSRLGLSDQEIEHNLIRFTNETQTGCLNPPTCPASSNQYRTIDGPCNSSNKTLLNLGRAASGYRRLLKPSYGDGMVLTTRIIFILLYYIIF